jgi:ElaA protein
MKIDWQWLAFADLNLHELYEILKLRQDVFVVEQQCPYPDADGRDVDCYHLLGWEKLTGKRGELIAYLRVLPPGLAYEELAMGRILTAKKVRGAGIGKELMKEGLRRVRETFGEVAVRISAQHYLKPFYEEFGFRQFSEPYDEDGIPHVEMLKE